MKIFGNSRAAVVFAIIGLAFTQSSGAAVINRSMDGLKLTYYELDSGKKNVIFTGGYSIKVEGNKATQTNTVKDLGGNVVGIEELVEKDGRFYSYSINRVNAGESGKVVVKGNKLQFTYTKGAKTKTSEEKLPERFVVGPGLTSYLHSQWSEALAGRDIPIKYGVVDRRDIFRFKLFRDTKKESNGKEVVVVQMKPATFIVSLLVDPIFFTLSNDGSTVYEVVGRTWLMINKGGKWKPLDAHLVLHHEARK